MGNLYRHPKDRDTVEWTSLGKFGKGPVRRVLVKDLSDEHLMKILEFMNRKDTYNYPSSIQEFMESEVIYRVENNIHIPEYYGQDDPIEGKSYY